MLLIGMQQRRQQMGSVTVEAAVEGGWVVKRLREGKASTLPGQPSLAVAPGCVGREDTVKSVKCLLCDLHCLRYALGVYTP